MKQKERKMIKLRIVLSLSVRITVFFEENKAAWEIDDSYPSSDCGLRTIDFEGDEFL